MNRHDRLAEIASLLSAPKISKGAYKLTTEDIYNHVGSNCSFSFKDLTELSKSFKIVKLPVKGASMPVYILVSYGTGLSEIEVRSIDLAEQIILLNT